MAAALLALSSFSIAYPEIDVRLFLVDEQRLNFTTDGVDMLRSVTFLSMRLGTIEALEVEKLLDQSLAYGLQSSLRPKTHGPFHVAGHAQGRCR